MEFHCVRTERNFCFIIKMLFFFAEQIAILMCGKIDAIVFMIIKQLMQTNRSNIKRILFQKFDLAKKSFKQFYLLCDKIDDKKVKCFYLHSFCDKLSTL